MVIGVTNRQAPVGAVKESSDTNAPARVEMCRVMDVNYDRHTVDVWSEFSNRRVPDVEMTCLYCHPDGEDGVYFMPEPGAEALIVFTSEARQYMAGYFIPTSEERGAAGVRPKMNPGDVVLSTRDRNHVILRRGGVVEVAATPLAQRLYIPIGNMIHDVFEQTRGTGVVGEYSWLHDPIDPETSQTDPEKEVKVLYTWKTREYAQDELASIELRAGHVDDEDGYIELVVAPQGGDHTLTWKVKKDGTLDLVMKGNLTYQVEGAIDISSSEQIRMSTGGFEVLADSGGKVSMKASSIDIDGGSRITEKSGDHRIESPRIRLGANASEKGVLGNKLASWLSVHRHSNGGAGPPTAADQAKLMQILSAIVTLE